MKNMGISGDVIEYDSKQKDARNIFVVGDRKEKIINLLKYFNYSFHVNDDYDEERRHVQNEIEKGMREAEEERRERDWIMRGSL